MRGRKVSEVRMHVGVQLGAQVVTAVQSERHKVQMELHPAGVHVRGEVGEFIIPYANSTSIKLLPEEHVAENPAPQSADEGVSQAADETNRRQRVSGKRPKS